jgi:hypothetical protein
MLLLSIETETFDNNLHFSIPLPNRGRTFRYNPKLLGVKMFLNIDRFVTILGNKVWREYREGGRGGLQHRLKGLGISQKTIKEHDSFQACFWMESFVVAFRI